MDVIKKIQAMCAERDWSIYNLAQEAVLTQSTLNSMIQRGTSPKIDTLQAICEAFGISLSQFFAENETLEPLTEDEKQLLSSYRRLTKEKRDALRQLVK